MERITAASAPTTLQRSVRLVGYPETCPRCHGKVVPRHIGTFARSHVLTTDVEEVFQCTGTSCGGLFIAVFTATEIGRRQPKYTYQRSLPAEPARPAVSGMSASLSPLFYRAYAQALGAEAAGLTELTGLGLRRALELLAKDFAKRTGDGAAIDAMPLAECVRRFIGDATVIASVERASWLRDDTTPYLRAWTAREIKELKSLLHLTTNAIESALEAERNNADGESG